MCLRMMYFEKVFYIRDDLPIHIYIFVCMYTHAHKHSKQISLNRVQWILLLIHIMFSFMGLLLDVHVYKTDIQLVYNQTA